MSPSKLELELEALSKAASTTECLVHAFQLSVYEDAPHNLDSPPFPNPLAVLNDACQILKAQTTKLSLLLINKPFAPGEIAHILNALNNSCLPALASTLDLCFEDKYTKFTWRTIFSCLASIWMELRHLVGAIPRTKEAVECYKSEGTLQSTGVLWATCDALLRLATQGVVPIAIEAVKERQALLQDAIDELDRWDVDDDSEDEEEGEAETIIATPTTSDEERLAEGMHAILLNPIDIQRTHALKHMRLVRLLYPALNKHRIKTFSNITSSTAEPHLPSPSHITIFDEIMRSTQSFTEDADEVAGALYSHDTKKYERLCNDLVATARKCAKSARLGYDGKEDGFSEWVEKWLARSEELSK